MNNLTALLLTGATFATIIFIGVYVWPNLPCFDLCKATPFNSECINIRHIQEEKQQQQQQHKQNNTNASSPGFNSSSAIIDQLSQNQKKANAGFIIPYSSLAEKQELHERGWASAR